MLRFRFIALPLLSGLASACQSAPIAPALVPVNQTGTPLPFVGNQEAPDEATRQLAKLGIQSSQFLGGAVQKLGALVGGFYLSEAKYRPVGYRVLSGVEGWEFRNGWYWRRENDDNGALRAQLQDAKGVGIPWDVSASENYAPDMHPGYPSNTSRVRLEYDQKLSAGARMALTFVLILPPERSTRLETSGSGLATVSAPLGQAGFEALNATFSVNGPVEQGDLVLKSLVSGTTLQFTGQYGPSGLTSPARLYRNAQEVGAVELLEGKWQFRNQSGSYSLD